MTAVVKSLARVVALSYEAVSDVMDGLAKGFVSKFTEVFKLESTMYHSGQTSTTYTRGSQSALGHYLTLSPKPRISITHYPQEIIDILPLGEVMLVPVGTAIETMALINASYLRISSH